MGAPTSDRWGHTKPFGSLNLRNQGTACTVSSLCVKPAVCGGGTRAGEEAEAGRGATAEARGQQL